MSLLSFSALLLIYMMTFLRPEKEDEEEEKKPLNVPKKLKTDPYLPFMSPTMIHSPFYYTYPSTGKQVISILHLEA